MIRWQGTMMLIGFRPFAAPTARVGSGPADRPGDLPVARRLAVSDVEEGSPDSALELRPLEPEHELEDAPAAAEILVELADGGVEGRRGPGGFSALPP